MFQPPVDHLLVGGDVVADQGQDHHHHVLGDADAVRVGDLGDGESALDRRLQVDVVGADARGQRQLQVRCLGDPLGGQVGGPERLGDHHLGLGQLALEDRVRPVLVGGDDEPVPAPLEELAQAELAGDAADQLAGREADRLRRRRALPVVVALDRRHLVARVGRRVAVDRIVVEHAEDRRHLPILSQDAPRSREAATVAGSLSWIGDRVVAIRLL